MESLSDLAKEISLKGKPIDLEDPRYAVLYSGTRKSDAKEYGLSTHCTDCNPRDC